MKKIILLTLLLFAFISSGFTQSDTTIIDSNITAIDTNINTVDSNAIIVDSVDVSAVLNDDTRRLVKEAEVKYITQTLVLDIDGDKIGDAMITEDGELYFTFIKEDMQKINNTLRIVALMDEVIEKYGTENASYIEIIDNMESKIVLYEEKISNLEKKNQTLTDENSELYGIIDDYKEKDAKWEEIEANKDEQIANLEKKNKWLKIGAGAGTVGTIGFVLCLLILL